VTIVEQVFAPVYGKPCWYVREGHGSMLTMEFGAPHLEVREPYPSQSSSAELRAMARRRAVHPRGEWHLWVYLGAWHYFMHGRKVGDWFTKGRMRRALRSIDGQALSKVHVAPTDGRSVLEFDLGGRLEIEHIRYRNDAAGEFNELWHLYQPDGRVFSMRGDGRYAHAPGDSNPDEAIWMQLPP